jgi:hypothetical protein
MALIGMMKIAVHKVSADKLEVNRGCELLFVALSWRFLNRTTCDWAGDVSSGMLLNDAVAVWSRRAPEFILGSAQKGDTRSS